MTTITKPLMADQNVTPTIALENLIDLTKALTPGDYIARSLVTDTMVYEVVKVTPKTVTLRKTRKTGEAYVDETCTPGAHGLTVHWQVCEPNPEGETITRRLTSTGTIKAGSHARAGDFYIPNMVNGQPVSRIDWRF